MENEKTYISLYVDKKDAEKYEQLKKIDGDHAALDSYMKSAQKHFKVDIESLDEDLAQYKARIIIWGKKLSDARNEMIESAEKMWADFDSKLYDVSKKANKISESFKPVQDQIKLIESNLQKLSDWKIERFMGLIDKIKGLSEKEAKILTFLMQNQDKLG